MKEKRLPDHTGFFFAKIAVFNGIIYDFVK